MCDTGYSPRRLVEDLRLLRGAAENERQMVEQAPNLAKRLVLHKHTWLRPYMCVPGEGGSSAGIYRLHEESDHSLAVFVVTWLPGDETPPHDHATWAVIAGLDGHETNHWWKRHDDGSVEGYADVRRSHSQRIDASTIIAMPGDAIHSLHNDSDGVSITLHMYGVNVDHTDRRKFDPRARTCARYRFGGTSNAILSGEQTS